MWIRREDYVALRADRDAALADLVEHRTRATVLAEQTLTHRTQTAFLIARINQLEKERAIMLRKITALEIPVPELAAVAAAPIAESDIFAALNANMFEDMGETEARRQGVTWDATGAVQYAGESANGRTRG